MCRNKGVREKDRCACTPEKQAIQQAKQRRRRANQRMIKAQTSVKAVISATPFRPESTDLLNLSSYEAYYDSDEWAEYDDHVRRTAELNGLAIARSQKADGIWLGSAEPAGAYEVYSDDPERIQKWASEIAGRYNQDAVSVAIVDPNGQDRLLTFDSADTAIDHEQALRTLRAAGIDSGRAVDGKLQIVSSATNPVSGDALALLESRLGAPSVTNVTATLVEKSERHGASAPVRELQALRQQYSREHGLPKRKKLPHFADADDIASAMAYEELPHDPQNPRLKRSYKAFHHHITQQYNMLIDAGYELEPWMGESEQPYADSKEMLADVRDRKHLYYYRTEASNETDVPQPDDHPMAPKVSVKTRDGGTKEIIVNDAFRAVHDALAHGDGQSFGPVGERNAWWAHRECLPREAHAALWNETRGQATWTNSGPHMRTEGPDGTPAVRKAGSEGWIPLAERPFPEQKSVNVPAWLT